MKEGEETNNKKSPGFSGTMGLILTSYLPIVQCHPSEPAPSLASCFILTQTMTSSVMPRTFGNPDDPEAYVKLPRYLVERKLPLFLHLFR